MLRWNGLLHLIKMLLVALAIGTLPITVPRLVMPVLASTFNVAPIWKQECFQLMDQLTTKLNQLPVESATTAHVVVAPSSRNIGGFLGQPYCIIYR